MSKVNIKAMEYHFQISENLYLLEKIMILLNLRSISFIGNASIYHNTVLNLWDEGAGLEALAEWVL